MHESNYLYLKHAIFYKFIYILTKYIQFITIIYKNKIILIYNFMYIFYILYIY
jgi:hypothetical protein